LDEHTAVVVVNLGRCRAQLRNGVGEAQQTWDLPSDRFAGEMPVELRHLKAVEVRGGGRRHPAHHLRDDRAALQPRGVLGRHLVEHGEHALGAGLGQLGGFTVFVHVSLSACEAARPARGQALR
jgi:hypothetical protein